MSSSLARYLPSKLQRLLPRCTRPSCALQTRATSGYPTTTTFLSLPSEIRLHIYKEIFFGQRLTQRDLQTEENPPPCLSILYTSNQVYIEAEHLVLEYATVRPGFVDGNYNFPFVFGFDWSRLRHVALPARICEGRFGRILEDMANLESVPAGPDSVALEEICMTKGTVNERFFEFLSSSPGTKLLTAIPDHDSQPRTGLSIMQIWENRGRSFKVSWNGVFRDELHVEKVVRSPRLKLRPR